MKNSIAKNITYILIIVFIILFVGYSQTHYTRYGIITEIEHDTQEITVTDTVGNNWYFYSDGYNQGDMVKIKMHTNYTDNIFTDDEIIKVYKIK